LDAAETERIRKEWDELLQTMAGLHAERDSARQECADAHRWINDLLGEVEKERESKIKVENMSVELTMQVGQPRARVQALEAEASRQSEEAHKLREQVNSKGLASPIAFFPGARGWLFDTIVMCL
jgi:chromosome segregation ATPase